jgi:hypothetical protein
MRHAQRGITLIEVLGSIAVGTLLFMGLNDMIDVSLEDAKGQQAAYQQSQLVNAARKYIAANYSSLVTASASAIAPVTVAQLKSGNFLSANFASTNSYGQNSCVLVRQPTANKLDALVATYGGQAIPDKNIAVVALSAGQGSGYISAANTAVAQGASWSLTTTPYRSVSCSGGASVLVGTAVDGGHLVSNLFYDGPGQLSTDFVYRDVVPGHPDFNRMNTPLQMASSALVTAGAACGAQPALAIESTTSSVMVCAAGVWKNGTTSTWKDPVANYAALGTGAAGDVRLTLDTKRAFAYNGTTWVALAVDQNGDMAIPRDVAVTRDARVTRDVIANGSISADIDVDVTGTLTVYNGEIHANNRIIGNQLIPAGYASPGDPCNTAVEMAGIKRDPGTGLPVICHKTLAQYRFARGTMTP